MNLQSQCRGDKIEHRWRMTMHLDGCHFYGSAYVCADCGALYSITLERDVKDDPYSAIWMDEEAQPEDERCSRCAELLAGAKPAEVKVVFEAAT